MNVNNFGLLNAVCALINSGEDSSDVSIARYLVKHLGDLQSVTSNEVIEEAFVTRSAVRRFCNRLGYRCWSDLKDSFSNTAYPSDLSHRDLSVPLGEYRSHIDEYITAMMNDFPTSLDEENIHRFAQDIHDHGSVEILCANNVQGNLLRFQQEMFFAGKCIPLGTWSDAAATTGGAGNLTIVVSVSGRFVDEAFERIERITGKKLLVTVCRDERYPELFDEVLYLSSQSFELDPLGVYAKYGVTYLFDLISADYLSTFAR